MTELREFVLGGLDALDPLAYFAALGCLSAITERARCEGLERPLLAWDRGSVVRARLYAPVQNDAELVGVLSRDLDVCAGRVEGGNEDRFLSFSYEAGSEAEVRDLKPRPADFRSQALEAVSSALPMRRRTCDWFAATLSDVAVDGKGNAKPFAFHFTAGQQRFLAVAHELMHGGDKVSGVSEKDLSEAIFGPWKAERKLKAFRWSPTQERLYALRASDPSDDKPLGTPGADWLALRAMTLISSAPMGKRIVTGGVRGGWKDGVFTYPVWETPVDYDAVNSLLRHPALGSDNDSKSTTHTVRRTVPAGIELFTVRIVRSDQGGYGAFTRPVRASFESASSVD